MADLFDRLKKKTVQEAGGDLLDRLNVPQAEPTPQVQAAPSDRTAAGIPTFEGLPGFEGRIDPNRQQPAPQQPISGPSVSERLLSAADRTGGQVAQALTTLAGLPVDAVTAAINLASEATTGQPLLEPEQQAFGRASVERFGAGTQAGVRNVGRGVGLVAPQTPEQRQAERQLADESLAFAAGEIFGEVAPFVAPAGAIGAIGSLIPRAIATGLLGATEGGIVSTGRGATREQALQTAEIGGGLGVTLEIVSPIVGRVANSIFRRFTGRAPTGQLVDANLNPTDEFLSVLDDAGLTIEDVQGQVLQEVRKGAIPEQAERAARFQAQGIPTTKGVITQDDILLGREETLLGRVDPVGEVLAAPIRERRLATSAAFERNAQEIIDDLGLAPDVGNSVKDALTQRRKLLVKEKNALYKAAAEADPELLRVPILSDNIVSAIPDQKMIARIGRLKPTETAAVQDLLTEFGLDQSDEAVESFLRGGGIIEPLSFSNFEDFRQGLNQIGRADQTGTVSNLINPIINVLDDELDTAFKAMQESPNITGNTLDIIKEARSKVRELKVEFDPKGTTAQLISFKKGGNIPTVESSEVFRAITKPSTSIEATDRLVKSLSKGGKTGRKALGDLQAAVVLEAFDKSMQTISNRSGGRQLFSANAFVRALKDIDGRGKLDVIFSNNKGMLKTLRDLEKSARETTTPGKTLPKGSAPAVNAILGALSGVRTLPLISQVSTAIEAGSVSARARGALDVTPQQRKTIEFITREYPALATVLGVGVAAQGETNDNQ